MKKDVVSSWLCSCISNVWISIYPCPIFCKPTKLLTTFAVPFIRKRIYILFYLLVQNAGEDLGVLEGAKPSKDRGGIQQEETILLGQDPFRVEPVLLNGLPCSCRRATLYCLLFVAWTLFSFINQHAFLGHFWFIQFASADLHNKIEKGFLIGIFLFSAKIL